MRNITQSLGMALFLGTPLAAQAQVSGDVVRIGVVTDLTGIYSEFAGQGLVSAVEMAVEDVGGEVAGQPIEIIVEDSRLDPEHSVDVATRLREQEDIDMLTGMVGSNTALAVQEYGAQAGLITMNTVSATANLTGPACSPYGVHWTYDTWALSAGTVNAVVKEGGKRWFFLVADYEFGYTMEEQARGAAESSGAEVVGRALTPYQGEDFSEQLQQAMASEANVIALANAGGDLQRTIRQAYELGLQNGERYPVALLMFLTDIRHLGLYVTAGLKFTTGFYWDRNEDTRAWSERFTARTGSKPSMAQAGAYSAVRHYLLSIADTGSDDSDAVMQAMRERPVNDFFATNGQLRPDGRMVHDMYLAEVKSPTQSRGAWDYLRILRTIPGEEAFRPMDQGGCPLVSAGS